MVRRIFLLMVQLCMAWWLIAPQAVLAQDPTPEPTITPTPAYLAEVALSPEVTYVVERRITYGDAAVVIAVGLLIAVIVVNAVLYWVRQWVR